MLIHVPSPLGPPITIAMPPFVGRAIPPHKTLPDKAITIPMLLKLVLLMVEATPTPPASPASRIGAIMN